MLFQLVRDALAPWRSAAASDDVVFLAMIEAGIETLPELPEALAEFARTNVVPLVARVVGAEAARAVEERLRRDATGGEPGFATRNTSSPAPAGAPVVVVLGTDARVARTAREALAGLAEVRALAGLVELAADERIASASTPPVVLVDCRAGMGGARPCPSTLHGAEVVLWYGRRFHETQLATLAPGAVLAETHAPGTLLGAALETVRALVEARGSGVTISRCERTGPGRGAPLQGRGGDPAGSPGARERAAPAAGSSNE